MARDGNGTYNRIHNWQTDADAGVDIQADRMDAEDDSIAEALTQSLAKDGQTVPTDNLPMGGFRHTGVGAGVARGDYAQLGQSQDGGFVYGTTTGSSNTYALVLSPAITAYAAGQRFYFKANHTNTGAATLNVNGVGAKSIVVNASTALVGGEIIINAVYEAVYDGTNFQLLGRLGQFEVGSWTPTVRGSVSAGDYTVAVRDSSAKYRRSGNKVTVEASFSVTVNSAGSGNLFIGGLPFVKPANAIALGPVRYANLTLPASTVQVTAAERDRPNTTSDLILSASLDNAASSPVLVTGVATGTTIDLRVEYGL